MRPDPMAEDAGTGSQARLAHIRAAAPSDVPAIRSILAAHGNDDPQGQLRGPDIVGPYVAHLLAHHIAMISETPGDGVVAFGAVADAGIAWHLADLFVRPDWLGQGLGRPLLAAMFGDRWPRTTFASDDPRALPAYVRAGMAARWVTLYIRGGAAEAQRAGADSRAGALEVVAADPAELGALELAWTGADRRVDHALWAVWPGADPFVIRDADGPVAVGYGRDRQVGPAARAVDRLVVRPGAEPVGPVLAAIARCTVAGDTIDVTVPGPHPALPVLLELGFRIDDRDVYCAGPSDPVDPAYRLVSGGLL
jgi:GNAT superfamily N-acetyltransferase